MIDRTLSRKQKSGTKNFIFVANIYIYIYIYIYFFFERMFQPISFVLDDSSLSLDQDTNLYYFLCSTLYSTNNNSMCMSFSFFIKE